jgi:hypothetical protein
MIEAMIKAMIKAMIEANLRARSGHRVAPCRTLAGDAEKAGGVERQEGWKGWQGCRASRLA